MFHYVGASGVHDIYSQAHHPPSNPIPITKVDDRVGSTSIKIDPSRVCVVDVYVLVCFKLARTRQRWDRRVNAEPSFLSQVIAIVESKVPDRTGENSESGNYMHHLCDSAVPIRSKPGFLSDALPGCCVRMCYRTVNWRTLTVSSLV